TVELVRPLTSTLFPYTTLFRSPVIGERGEDRARVLHVLLQHERAGADHLGLEIGIRRVRQDRSVVGGQRRQERAIRRLHRERHRSEEHTSELQSRENLVCRLLL